MAVIWVKIIVWKRTIWPWSLTFLSSGEERLLVLSSARGLGEKKNKMEMVSDFPLIVVW